MTINPTLTASLRVAIERAIATGFEEGIQLCVFQHGQRVVDLTVGTRDDAGTPLRPDDLSFVWSTSKGITATAVHILAERGLIQYDDAIADYWPAFARNGKAAISIRHIMSHTAGIYLNPVLNGYEELRDYETVCTAIAAMTPLHQPGQSHIYHPLTYGWPLAKVVEAVTGMPFGAFIQTEICAPLGLTDLFIGLPVARQADVARTSIDVDPALLQATPDNPLPDPSIMANDPAIWATCMPAANMLASARAIATVYAALIGDGVNGVRLLSQRQVANATRVQCWLVDAESQHETGHSLGFALGKATAHYGALPTAFGHCGYGGSTGFADPQYDMAFAMTKTRMNLHPEAPSLKRELAAIVRQHLPPIG